MGEAWESPKEEENRKGERLAVLLGKQQTDQRGPADNGGGLLQEGDTRTVQEQEAVELLRGVLADEAGRVGDRLLQRQHSGKVLQEGPRIKKPRLRGSLFFIRTPKPVLGSLDRFLWWMLPPLSGLGLNPL